MIRAISYLAVTGGCIAALSAGTVYLLTAYATAPAVRKPPAIAPRIAESNARKIAVAPRVVPTPVSATAPEPEPEPMKEAKASLPAMSEPRRIAPPPQRVEKVVRVRHLVQPQNLAARNGAGSNARVQEYRVPVEVTTARSDVPY